MLRSNKRAVSTIIAYVLLIGLAVSMSVLVHNWLKLHVAEDKSQTCPDAVSLSIEKVFCSADEDELNLTLKNRGNFIIEDVLVKVSNNSEVGTNELKLNYAVNLGIGESVTVPYSLVDLIYDSPTYVSVQPVIFEDGEMVYCSQTIGQEINCGSQDEGQGELT